MAVNIVNEVSSLINQQVKYQENIQEHLQKAEAIANVALCEDFLNYEQSVIHAYIWVLCDMISETRKINEQSLNTLLKTTLI